jgi:hypothetical protein
MSILGVNFFDGSNEVVAVQQLADSSETKKGVVETNGMPLVLGLNNLIVGLAGRAWLAATGACESTKEGSSGNQEDTVQGMTQEPFCSNQYYLCDRFEGEGIETDVWKVSVKGEGVSYGVDAIKGELTMSSSQGNAGLDTGVGFVSAQPAV